MNILYFLINIALAGNPKTACQQHNPMNPDVPLCPSSGSTLLSENYPIMAATVSDEEGGATYVKEYVVKVLKAQSKSPPQFFLHVSPETHQDLLQEIKKQAPDPQTEKEWLATLSLPPTKSRWNWQQDYFESFFDPRTGKPVLREVQGYGRHGDSFRALSSQAEKDCTITPGPLLDNKKYRSGHSGGNIEAINGLCLVGSDHFIGNEWDDYAKSTCQNMNAAVKAPSDFLKVGHTDEFFKTLKDPKQKAPCDFALAFASPQKGLELLKASPDERAFDFSKIPAADILTRFSEGTYADICTRHLKIRAGQPSSPSKGSGKQGRGVSWMIFDLSIPSASADSNGDLEQKRFERFLQGYFNNDSSSPRSAEEQKNARERSAETRNQMRRALSKSGYIKPMQTTIDIGECYNMKNKDLIKVLETDPELKAFNVSVNQTIQKFKNEVLEKLKTQYPQCSPKTIDFPDLFVGMMNNERNPGTYAVGTADSIFPNPTNGDIIENTYLIPEPVNDAFKKDIEKSIHDLGLKTDYIDTHFAHVLNGNLHCSSHTMRYCRPQGDAK